MSGMSSRLVGLVVDSNIVDGSFFFLGKISNVETTYITLMAGT